MKLMKWNEIRWDIVRQTAKTHPWTLVGWPITACKTTSRTLFRVGMKDNGIRSVPMFEVRIPFTYKVIWTWDGEYHKSKMYPVVSHRTLLFQWNKFLWFWRVDQ